ncbi:type 3 dihydrofolate reductase [Sinimarinibacterium sp. CAU 1509]|uniref:type 3 dihydrofolate reductase n=1 Tax=Sinimarinibacterium sp. CAU 1509 TaxID=2562283 RepID=UPI0010AB913F|nr:type 3 dihydrofolate reductase [Sinimarinibacterium sp. CAU 1509]TJY61031.1 type 3 dihydrofolate reductase [Sinimarinibacterium sp. CAU 1509]
MLSLIAALDRNRVIGRNGDLPWRLPDDLRHFKRLTRGKTVLMGRKTWISLGRPLPERDNWVISRDPAFRAEGARVFQSLETALQAHEPSQELMVIGGAELYRQLLSRADRLYLTEVDAEVDGDAWFPDFDRGQWRETAREVHAPDERHAYAFAFITLDRAP